MVNYDPFAIDGDPIDQAEQGERLAPNQYQDKHSEQFAGSSELGVGDRVLVGGCG